MKIQRPVYIWLTSSLAVILVSLIIHQTFFKSRETVLLKENERLIAQANKVKTAAYTVSKTKKALKIEDNLEKRYRELWRLSKLRSDLQIQMAEQLFNHGHGKTVSVTLDQDSFPPRYLAVVRLTPNSNPFRMIRTFEQSDGIISVSNINPDDSHDGAFHFDFYHTGLDLSAVFPSRGSVKGKKRKRTSETARRRVQ